jgi:hypothetical protein
MEKAHGPKQELKRVRSLKLHKETLRELETSQLHKVAAGLYTVGGPSCDPTNPCYTR